MFGYPQGHGLLATLEIGTSRRRDDAENIFLRRAHAEEGLAREQEGAQIKAAFAARNPVRVDLHQLRDCFEEQVFGDFGHRQPLGRLREAAGIFLRPEHGDAAVGEAVGLHAFEDFLGIMQHGAGRVDLKWFTRTDAVAVPALALGIADRHHMVGEEAAETGILQQGGALVRRHSLAAAGNGETRTMLAVHNLSPWVGRAAYVTKRGGKQRHLC